MIAPEPEKYMVLVVVETGAWERVGEDRLDIEFKYISQKRKRTFKRNETAPARVEFELKKDDSGK